MDLVKVEHICPCCGYRGLDSPPYDQLPPPPWDPHPQPPYSMHYGQPSYEVCACCGFEYGNDDEPGTASPVTFEQYRKEWMTDGYPWFDESKRPTGWTPDAQLQLAGIQEAG
jgi:hypothetical protein